MIMLINLLHTDLDCGICKVRRAMVEDITELSSNMSVENAEELWMAWHMTPEQAINIALKESTVSLTILANGKPIGIFGVMKTKEKKTEIFFLVTNNFAIYGKVFLRHARDFIDKFLQVYPVLEGHVYNKNIKSIEWMKYCGCMFDGSAPYGIEGKLFSHFTFERRTC